MSACTLEICWQPAGKPCGDLFYNSLSSGCEGLLDHYSKSVIYNLRESPTSACVTGKASIQPGPAVGGRAGVACCLEEVVLWEKAMFCQACIAR